jgi:hypothetical protein
MVQLRQALTAAAGGDANMPAQNGSADFAIELLDVPWRQRFQGHGGIPEVTGPRIFEGQLPVAKIVNEQSTVELVHGLLQP